MTKRLVFTLISLIFFSSISRASSEKYLELADSAGYFISLEMWNKAEEKILQALRLEPANFNNSMLLSNLGIIQTQKEEYTKAIDSFTLGLSIAPSSTVLLNNRAKAFLLSDNISDAILDINSSLQIDSVQEWPLQTRGYLYLKEHQLTSAFNIFEKLKTEFPDNSHAYAGLAYIAELKGENNDALELYNTALEKDPENEDNLVSYIFLLIDLEKYSDARTKLRKAIEKNPDNPMFYLQRGYLHRLNYRLDEAQADKKIALDKGLNPDYVKKFIP